MMVRKIADPILVLAEKVNSLILLSELAGINYGMIAVVHPAAVS
jgi:hypothetical protein